MKTTSKFYSLLSKILFASFACNLALASTTANASILNASAGGTFTFNYDSAALGQYVYGMYITTTAIIWRISGIQLLPTLTIQTMPKVIWINCGIDTNSGD